MSQKTKSYLIYFLPVFVFVLLAFGVVYAQNYDSVNVGPGSQYKHGGLGVGGYFRTYSGAVLGDIGSFIGIGMADPAAPQASLDIRNARSSGDFRVSNMGGIYVETSDSNISAGIALSSQGIAKGSIYMGHVRVAGHGSQDSKVGDGVIGVRGGSSRLVFATGAKGVAPQPARMIIDEKGNIGIGTTNPQAKLEVAGSLKTGAIEVAGNITLHDGVVKTKTPMSPNYAMISDARGVVVWQDLSKIIQNFSKGTEGVSIIKGITVTDKEDVGIGTISPKYKLDIIGDVGIDGNLKITKNLNVNGIISLAENSVGLKIAYGAGSGKVLTSDDKGNATWQNLPANYEGGGGINSDGSLSIIDGYKTTGLTGMAGGIHIAGKGGSPNSGQIVWGDNTGWKLNFGTRLNGNFIERVTFTDTGNVGIGTANPRAKLDVNGGISIKSMTINGSKLCYYKCYSEQGKVYCDTYRTDNNEVVTRRAAYLGFDTAITKDAAHHQLVICNY